MEQQSSTSKKAKLGNAKKDAKATDKGYVPSPSHKTRLRRTQRKQVRPRAQDASQHIATPTHSCDAKHREPQDCAAAYRLCDSFRFNNPVHLSPALCNFLQGQSYVPAPIRFMSAAQRVPAFVMCARACACVFNKGDATDGSVEVQGKWDAG